MSLDQNDSEDFMEMTYTLYFMERDCIFSAMLMSNIQMDFALSCLQRPP